MRVLLYAPEHRSGVQAAAILRNSEFEGIQTNDAEEAFFILKNYEVSLTLLVTNDSASKCVEVIRVFRSRVPETPLIVLAPADGRFCRAECLDGGADDVITRELQTREVLARFRVVIRRASGHSESLLRVGGLTMNLASRVAKVDGKPLHLTRKEGDLLKLLLLKRDSLLSRQKILSSLWDMDEEPETRVVDLLVFQLRRKLAAYGLANAIETVRGSGYRIQRSLAGTRMSGAFAGVEAHQQHTFPFLRELESRTFFGERRTNVG